MKRNILALLAIIIALTVVLVGCTESFTQDAIAGDYSNLVVESNGGLAVKANNYIFYINGYAGETGDNVFGEAIKGAIMRAELKDGVIDESTIVTVVPKNVYGTVKTSGIFVVGNYIYYTCPSTRKNNKGEFKTTNMTLLRTSLDGTTTDEIITFDDYTPTFKVGATAIMYFDSTAGELHSISLAEKDDFADSLVEEKVTGCVFSATENGNPLNEVAFYTKASTDTTATHNTVYKVFLDGSAETELFNGLSSYPEAIRVAQIGSVAAAKGFSITLSQAILGEGLVRLIYNKSDSGTNTVSQGIYMYELDSNLVFDAAKETKLSSNGKIADQDDAYTAYRFIDNNNLLATGTSSIQWLSRNVGDVQWTVNKRSGGTHAIGVAATLMDYKVINGKGVVYYFNGTAVDKYTLFDYAANGAISYADENSVRLISSIAVTSSWLAAELIGDNLIYWDSGVSNYTYTINIGAVTYKGNENVYDQDTVKSVLLSVVTDVDRATLAV